MKLAFIHTKTSTFMLAVCLAAPCTALATVKPPEPERIIPLTTYEPPELHTNQGGRSAAGDMPFKPLDEMPTISLHELFFPHIGSGQYPDIDLLMPNEMKPAAVPRSDMFFTLKPFNIIDHSHVWPDDVAPQSQTRRAVSLVPGPGVLPLLLGGMLGVVRRRRRT